MSTHLGRIVQRPDCCQSWKIPWKSSASQLITTSFGCFSFTALLSSSCDFPSRCQTHFLFQTSSVFRIHLHFLFPSQHVPTLGPIFPRHGLLLCYHMDWWEGKPWLVELKYNQQPHRGIFSGLYALCSWCTYSLKDLRAQGLVWSMSLNYLLFVIKLQRFQSVKMRKWKHFVQHRSHSLEEHELLSYTQWPLSIVLVFMPCVYQNVKYGIYET